MPIYRTSKKEIFLSEVSEFICTNFKDNFDNVKIILPNGHLCNHLQKIIINKIGTAILPSIIPVGNIGSEKDETFKIPSEQIGKITALEERIILAEIINSYDKLNYNKAKSLELSPSLAKLFFEFEANNVEFQTLKNIPILDQAEHWHFIYDFLEFAYNNWQKKIINIKKLTPAAHQKLMFNAELGRVKNSDCSTIIAGVIGNNKITQDFICAISKLKNGYIILPPLPQIDISNLKLKTEDPLYNIAKITSNFLSIPCLDKLNGKILDNLLAKTSSTNFADNLEYVEFDHVLREAEYVAIKCFELIKEDPDAKIAILITNDKVKNYFTAKFDKYGLCFSDLIGENILKTQLTTLLIEIASNICKNFSLKDFISLISHPLVISNETIRLKKLIVKHNRFAQNIDEDLIVNAKCETNFLIIEQERLDPNKQYNFNEILKKIIKISEELCPNLWNQLNGKKISDILVECAQFDWYIDDIETLPEIIKSMLSGGRIFDNEPNSNSNITICSANDVTLINYDLLIYTNFIQGTYPLPQINSPWLNNQMIEGLGLDSWAARFGNSMYDFYLNLHNKKVLITRSIKTDDFGTSMPSPFLFRLKHILGSNFKQTSVDVTSEPRVIARSASDEAISCRTGLLRFARNDGTPRNDASEEYAYSDVFPEQISATDIETLIRTPYNFYAKKILNLKPENEIEEDPKLSEFGNIFHKIVELYTKNYGTIYAKSLKEYSKELLDKSIFPKQTQNFWQLKIESLEKDFILFDEQRRSKAKQIFSELRGTIKLEIAGTKVKIVAVADRIELTEENKAIIIDYKTGTVPTKKDVLSGLSPQLIIEAILLLEGGFADIGKNIEIFSLLYVKINSKEPFISETEIEMSKNDILEHKQGLVNLLSHYITTGKYAIEPNLMKYDNYWHLARRG